MEPELQGLIRSSNEVLLKDLDGKMIDEQIIEDDSVPIPSQDTDLEGKADESQQDKTIQDKGKNKVGTSGNSKEWVALFKNNRTPSHCVALHKVENQGKAGTCKLEAKDLIPLEKAWGSALIGYFAGKNPGSWCLNRLVKSWKVKVKHHYHKTGWIVFQFLDDRDMMEILDGGPYFAGYQPLILKQMPELFRFDDVVMRTMPVWVTLMSLPKECWGVDSMSKIISLLGEPMRLDMRTSTLDAVSYARALVLVDASTDLLFKVTVEIEGKSSFEQEVIYDYIPTFCTLCNTIGHKNVKCHLKGKYVAVDKDKEQKTLSQSLENERVDKQDKQDASKMIENTEDLLLGNMSVDCINLVNGESSSAGRIRQGLDLDNRFAALAEDLGNLVTPVEDLPLVTPVEDLPLVPLTDVTKSILDQSLDKSIASTDDPGGIVTTVPDQSKGLTALPTNPDPPKDPPVSGSSSFSLVPPKAKKGTLADSANKRVTRQELKGTNKKQFIGSYQPPNKK